MPKPYSRLNNLGKYAHKPKVDVGSAEDDMSADPRRSVNPKPQRRMAPSAPPTSTKLRRG